MPEVPPLDDDVGYLLSRASGLSVRRTNVALAPVGLRVRQYSVLVLTAEQPDGTTQRRIAERLGLDPSQVVALVDELQAAGHVQRVADPADRRTRLVVLTAGGRAHLAAAVPLAGAAVRGALGDLDAAEVVTLTVLLSRVVAGSGAG